MLTINSAIIRLNCESKIPAINNFTYYPLVTLLINKMII